MLSPPLSCHWLGRRAQSYTKLRDMLRNKTLICLNIETKLFKGDYDWVEIGEMRLWDTSWGHVEISAVLREWLRIHETLFPYLNLPQAHSHGHRFYAPSPRSPAVTQIHPWISTDETPLMTPQHGEPIWESSFYCMYQCPFPSPSFLHLSPPGIFIEW